VRVATQIRCFILAWCTVSVFATSGIAASKKVPAGERPLAPEIDLPDGRKLTYEGTFASERDAQGKRGFWKKLLDVVAGEPTIHALIRPYSIVTDSNQRIIVTDPGASAVHIFDFQKRSYKFLTHSRGKDVLKSPQCVAIDDRNNIYVTDSSTGKIFVFDADGKFRHTIGSLPGGEGFFKRPTGIAIDSAAQLIYVSDTLRNKVFVLNMQGQVLRTIGQNGSAPGDFNYPTDLLIHDHKLLVVDAMNFRIQSFETDGTHVATFGQVGDGEGHVFRPKGLALDGEGHYYVADGFHNTVQVFDREGNLLYVFGAKGIGPGEFQLPAGIAIDHQNRVFVVDSYNRRIQIFHYFGSGS
jgi:DNA-binding beta-propeller fold protein YncE